MKDYVAEMGGAALGARLRRLSAAVDAASAKVYAARGIRFEQRWFGVINQLDMAGPMSVRELADTLGITHASVSETRKSLEGEGLITSQTDSSDTRRRVLALSPSGEALVTQLRSLWDAFDEAARQLDAEAGGVALVLAKLERALAARPLHVRIADIASAEAATEGPGRDGE